MVVPPVPAPLVGIVDQATSLEAAHELVNVRVVPPTAVTSGSLAGNSGERGNEELYPLVRSGFGFEPPSPEQAREVMPTAANWANVCVYPW